MSDALITALALLVGLDSKLVEIVLLSLRVSLSAVAIAAILGLPLGAAIAVGRFPGRQTVIVVLNALMGLPPVVVGLLVYLLLSRAGPFGSLGILFTPSAMICKRSARPMLMMARTMPASLSSFGSPLMKLRSILSRPIGKRFR